MLYNIFLIHSPSGRQILERNYALFQADSSIFCGIISTLKLLVNEIHFGELSNFSTKNFNVVFASTEEILTTIVIDLTESVDAWQKIAFEICRKFENKYGSLKSWNGRLNDFVSFHKELDSLLIQQSEDELIEVGLWAKKQFGGDLHIITSRYIDLILDKGEREVFHSLRYLLFFKILRGGNLEEEILKVTDFCKGIDPFDENRNKKDLLSYFPAKLIFILSNNLEIESNKFKALLKIDQKKPLYIVPNKIGENQIQLDFLKCDLEAWNWKFHRKVKVI